MILFLLAVIALSFYKMKFTRLGTGLNTAYLAPDRTTAVKGIFVLLVFLSHASNYLLEFPAYTADVLNQPYITFQSHLGQGVVVMFLFYSGYGVMESVQKRGRDYVRTMPGRRILKTLLHFDIAVLLYLLLDLALGTLSQRAPLTVVLAFTGWTSLGNSNWYIFAVLFLYFFTFLAFTISPARPVRALWMVTAFTGLYIAVLAFLKDAWWFDTVLLYPLGMWYSFYKDKIEAFLRRKGRYWAVLAGCLLIMIASHLLRANYLCYEIWMISLAAFVVLLTMKLDICNPVLLFFGRHLFEIYILMRIPMLVLLHFEITQTYAFIGISLAVTVLLAALVRKFFGVFDAFLFSRVPQKGKTG